MKFDYSKPYLKWITVDEFFSMGPDFGDKYLFRDSRGFEYHGYGSSDNEWHEWGGSDVHWDTTICDVTHVAIPLDKPDYLTCMLHLTEYDEYLSIEIFGSNDKKLTIYVPQESCELESINTYSDIEKEIEWIKGND